MSVASEFGGKYNRVYGRMLSRVASRVRGRFALNMLILNGGRVADRAFQISRKIYTLEKENAENQRFTRPA